MSSAASNTDKPPSAPPKRVGRWIHFAAGVLTLIVLLAAVRSAADLAQTSNGLNGALGERDGKASKEGRGSAESAGLKEAENLLEAATNFRTEANRRIGAARSSGSKPPVTGIAQADVDESVRKIEQIVGLMNKTALPEKKPDERKAAEGPERKPTEE